MTSKQELEMFGCSIAVLKTMFERPSFGSSPEMLVLSILSDVQELMSMVAEGDSSGHTGDRLELARQYVNRAKFGVTEYLRG